MQRLALGIWRVSFLLWPERENGREEEEERFASLKYLADPWIYVLPSARFSNDDLVLHQSGDQSRLRSTSLSDTPNRHLHLHVPNSIQQHKLEDRCDVDRDGAALNIAYHFWPTCWRRSDISPM